MSKTSRPTVYIIAGPNGAGKTTFASEFLYRPWLDSLRICDATQLPPQLIAIRQQNRVALKRKEQYRQLALYGEQQRERNQ